MKKPKTRILLEGLFSLLTYAVLYRLGAPWAAYAALLTIDAGRVAVALKMRSIITHREVN